jgi:integrase
VSLGLKLGLRELEIAHAMWSNIDFTHSIYHVKSAPAFDWKIKDKEERAVPIPADLVKELKARRARYLHTKLIVGTTSDKPNYHLLRSLKRAVRSSGFNCRECRGCTGKTNECSVYDLHTLRRTYITKLLRSGLFDIATIQAYVGHSDLATTSRYLKGEEAHAVQDKLNKVDWGDRGI